MEKILAIKPWLEHPRNPDIEDAGDQDTGQEGYEIVTTAQRIRLSIDNDQRCCERWGYLWSNDNPQEFIGATLLDMTLTDTLLHTHSPLPPKLTARNEDDESWANTSFVNLETDRGTLQFVAYNAHNGYYGHRVVINSQQLQHTEVL